MPAGLRLTPELIVRAYSIGIFPMADARDDPTVYWVAPERRGILPLDRFHVPRRLRRTVRRGTFEVRRDTAFAEVIEQCAAPRPGHPETWINPDITRVFCDLHRAGLAHCVETWREGRLVGGIYGLALGGAFFGESMFSRETDASKVALVHLAASLRVGGFTLFDAQFLTDHLRQFGAIEVPAAAYMERLNEALRLRASFYRDPVGAEAELSALLTQSSTQTS